jgi:hypothetical protein
LAQARLSMQSGFDHAQPDFRAHVQEESVFVLLQRNGIHLGYGAMLPASHVQFALLKHSVDVS